MIKKEYITPLTEIVEATYGEPVMDWVSTPVTDDELDNDELNAKGFVTPEDKYNPYTPWED
ncbi:HAD family hydrolase [Prevotella fusca]